MRSLKEELTSCKDKIIKIRLSNGSSHIGRVISLSESRMLLGPTTEKEKVNEERDIPLTLGESFSLFAIVDFEIIK